MRWIVIFTGVALVSAATASPLDEDVPFTLEEGLACSAVLHHASKTDPSASPFGDNDRFSNAFLGYALGSANLANKAGKGPKFVDKDVEARQTGVKAMSSQDRSAARTKCEADFAGYMLAANK